MYNMYNRLYGVLLMAAIFAVSMYVVGVVSCNCDYDTGFCKRYEFYGVQFSHFFFFTFLGFYFPSYFVLIQTGGVLWEVFEYYLEQNEEIAKHYFGGCLSEKPATQTFNPPYFYRVYRDIPKYKNPVDQLAGIDNSKTIIWHSSVAEIIPNVVGFLFGSFLNQYVKFK